MKMRRPLSQAKKDAIAKATEAAAAKKRALTHCYMGHELTGDNVYIRKEGFRQCKECMRVNRRIHRQHWKAILEANPNHELHGTFRAYRYGCMCFRCRLAASERNYGSKS